ncbi:proline-serine-threonine phosphatase-interacting protein 2 isoform X3 [Hydra vulgaris]|uniref:Proline-serine-threonine phosphatase-interacting protein 2 isoform X3 n=1 Tax=Hydra vulgaris TaxID=6087 RepID=A0ABM4DEY0_HYDVU
MVKKFEDNFWDLDFNGTLGYDTLLLRLKEGKKFCDSFTDFLRNRSKLEDDYGKNLIKLSQSGANIDESGSLKASWDSIRKGTEYVGNIHCELAKKLNDLVDRTSKFREKYKNERLKVDDKMKKSQKEKKVAYENLNKAKKVYEQRCKETDQCQEMYDSKSSFTQKEEERLKRSLSKSKTYAENSDSVYQSSVKILEDCHKKWASDMEEACQVFQNLEEERIQFLRNEFWIYTNLGSTQAVDIDEKYEDCRKVIEKCDHNNDIDLFISQKRTGSERPAFITYENFYYNTKSSLGRSQLKINESSMDEGDYTTIGQVRSVTSTTLSNFAKVIYTYDAQSNQELSLAVGDVIEILKIEDNQWGIGILNGRRGAFPLNFVRR